MVESFVENNLGSIIFIVSILIVSLIVTHFLIVYNAPFIIVLACILTLAVILLAYFFCIKKV
jgi:hypothetical protein